MNSRYDIIVAGGGISGAIAAVAASREGAKVLLIERDGSLGGAATNGLVYPFARYLAKDNKKTENGKRKAENFLIFRFSLGEENGALRLSREQRVLAHYAEAEQRKACRAGLKRKTF